MWPSIKHWLDWAMDNLWPLYRLGTRPQLLHHSYEKAGLTLSNQPIPWNAETVVVEALLRMPDGRSRSDFQLHLPGRAPISAESLRREEQGSHYRIFFRFPPPPHTLTAELRYRSTPLGELPLTVLSREEFITSLRVAMSAVYVHLGDRTVACQTFVASQCKGLTLGAVLVSPTSLVPLADLDLRVELRSERKGLICTMPASLTSSQLASRQALVNLIPKRPPRVSGVWSAIWMVGDVPLHVQRFRAVSLSHFHRSLRVSDTRFLVSGKNGLTVQQQLPLLETEDRVGPCFLVSSQEAGMAGLCKLSVHALLQQGKEPSLLEERQVLITDGPTLVAPGTLNRDHLGTVSGFELRLRKKVLGTLLLRNSATAVFTSEGGFKPPDDFLWTAAAEQELHQRLNKLMDGSSKGLC